VAGNQVPDTSAFILAIRELQNNPGGRPRLLRSAFRGRLYVSAVVAAELYAGTRSVDDKRFIDEIVVTAKRARRYLTPTGADWEQAGQMINHMRDKGIIDPRPHLADLLIVLAAARVQGAVLTKNVHHMTMWAEAARRSGWKVTVEKYGP